MQEQNQSILVVEDNRAMSSVLRFNIRKAGYEVFIAENGVEGLQILEQQKIDFVSSDYQMPQMGGHDFARNMRQMEAYQTTPLVMCSAKGFELDHEELFNELNILKLFYKPFSPREIVAFIQETLSTQSPTS